ncbi:MAG: cation:proton antiporter, partial [Bacteroidota bacterium]
MRKMFLYLLMFALIYQGISTFVYAKDNAHKKQEVEHITDDTGHEHEQEHDEGHGPGMEPLLFIIIALIIGAGTRYLLRKSFLPYTVSLLIIGILLGILVRMGFLGHSLTSMCEAVKWAGNIDPHLILYVFLPTLIFEAAFAMDVHTFKKSFANASIMAIPGIIIALVLAGALVMLLNSWNIGLSGWGWPIALLFGTVISATDPVAVVALLKDLGASKKLGTLIEGESLLNDGTAIVIFMVLLTGITGQVAGNSPVVEFLKVAVGGALLGIVIGYITMSWVGKVFNDAMVEISVMIAAAYLTFFIAEYFLHVSGVLGVVSFGLLMASSGRTKISPGVEHFLHEFWELAAFIANTLIFLIVGLVIAQQTIFRKSDFLILILIYIGIHVIRAFVITIFFPAMKKVGYGIKKKEAYVLWWGALRGAIGLALALVVAGVDNQYIPETIRNQFLFLTAGVVTMTLVINATTIGWLVEKLGITKLSPAKAAMIHNSRQYLRQAVENWTVKMKNDRYINRANWNIVEQYYPDVPEQIESEHTETNTISEIRRRILEKEKSSYWHQFKDGMIGEGAVRTLTDAINEILDSGGKKPLSERDDLEKLWQTPSLLHKLEKIPFLKKIAEKIFFDKLSVSYDAARGFLEAQKEVLNMVGSMYRSIEAQNKE